MTDLDVLEKLRDITTVGIVRKANKASTNIKQPYVWAVQTIDASQRLLLAIYPWLHSRRQAKVREVFQARHEYVSI